MLSETYKNGIQYLSRNRQILREINCVDRVIRKSKR